MNVPINLVLYINSYLNVIDSINIKNCNKFYKKLNIDIPQIAYNQNNLSYFKKAVKNHKNYLLSRFMDICSKQDFFKIACDNENKYIVDVILDKNCPPFIPLDLLIDLLAKNTITSFNIFWSIASKLNDNFPYYYTLLNNIIVKNAHINTIVYLLDYCIKNNKQIFILDWAMTHICLNDNVELFNIVKVYYKMNLKVFKLAIDNSYGISSIILQENEDLVMENIDVIIKYSQNNARMLELLKEYAPIKKFIKTSHGSKYVDYLY